MPTMMPALGATLWRFSDVTSGVEEHDGAQHLAAVHPLERGLDVVEADPLRHELVEWQPSLQVQVDQHREVTRGQAVAVPARLHRTTATEHVDERQVEPHLRRRYADKHHPAGEVARVERLRERLD